MTYPLLQLNQLRSLSFLFAPFFACILCSACSNGQEPTQSAEAQPFKTEAAAPAVPRTGEDWPHFLGPTHDGISTETGLLDSWPADGPPLVWEREVGTGYSAPSILNGRLVLHHRINDEEIVECFNAETGKQQWSYSSPSRFRDPYGYNNGPRCSPILTDEHCFTLGAEGRLLCLKLTAGSLVWERQLRDEYDIPDGFFGVGSTPILEGDRLIVPVGGQPNSGIVAFDKNTGKPLWSAVGQATWDSVSTGWASDDTYDWTGEEMVVSYSSPIAATIHGQRHILCLMRHGLVSLNPETGEENFRHWFRSRTHESVNAARPVVVDDTILLSAAYRVGATLLRVQPDGKSYEVVWSDPRNLLTHWSTSIPLDGYFLGFSGRHENEGELRCIDAKTGEVKWSTTGASEDASFKRAFDGSIVNAKTGETVPFPFYGRGSKILADGKFIILAERGTLALCKATTEGWEEISRCSAPRMKYPSWTAPVLSHGLLYLRCEDALVCLDLKASNPQ
ncbi:PQQ-binding-like beta-propeller repeat protein [Thalassoglobus sp. JC818]|uniref:PQQ-binding-like beta-propeller repeat protein n=1 Tax=Thalassoglobus sp. JC818 TaxID=3232136 RepID=UPI0034581832